MATIIKTARDTRVHPLVVQDITDAPQEYFYISVGSFYDRFGDAKIAVLTSTDATIQALLKDTQVREYIDLARTDVQQFVGYLGAQLPDVTPEVIARVLDLHTTEEERVNKGLPQLQIIPNDG